MLKLKWSWFRNERKPSYANKGGPNEHHEHQQAAFTTNKGRPCVHHALTTFRCENSGSIRLPPGQGPEAACCTSCPWPENRSLAGAHNSHIVSKTRLLQICLHQGRKTTKYRLVRFMIRT